MLKLRCLTILVKVKRKTLEIQFKKVRILTILLFEFEFEKNVLFPNMKGFNVRKQNTENTKVAKSLLLLSNTKCTKMALAH